MKSFVTKTFVLGGLCAFLVGTSSAVFAQGMEHHGHHHMIKQARHHITKLQSAYARAKAHGNYAAAERIHQKAKAIRHHVRTAREMHADHM